MLGESAMANADALRDTLIYPRDLLHNLYAEGRIDEAADTGWI